MGSKGNYFQGEVMVKKYLYNLLALSALFQLLYTFPTPPHVYSLGVSYVSVPDDISPHELMDDAALQDDESTRMSISFKEGQKEFEAETSPDETRDILKVLGSLGVVGIIVIAIAWYCKK